MSKSAQENAPITASGSSIKKPPIRTHNDRDTGAFVKVWENMSKEGRLFYNVTIGSAYRDKETGEWNNTSNLSPAQMNALNFLLPQANHTIALMESRKLDNEKSLMAGLKAQRDQLIAQARPKPIKSLHQSEPSQVSAPVQEQ